MAPRKNRQRNDSSSDTSIEDPEPRPAPKKAKSSSAKDDDNEPSWALDKKRFLKVREFKGKVFVDIREYYDADGVLKPGKKGISLSAQQWKKLVEVVDEVEKALSEK